jgi:methionyl-tRNA formyltransferase
LSSSNSSWIVPYGYQLQDRLIEMGHQCKYIFSEKEVLEGDVLVFLCYEKIFNSLHLNKHNLVIHESDLPEGRGMSPLTWQILEGKNTITCTLLEASEGIDEGDIYEQFILNYNGSELNTELKHKQGNATIELVLNFMKKYPINIRRKQTGKPSYYPKRTPLDSELDPKKSIAEQFNLLRVCDNERYPAFFSLNGKKYKLLIIQDNE